MRVGITNKVGCTNMSRPNLFINLPFEEGRASAMLAVNGWNADFGS
jgi:hypothetical protein